MTKITTPFPLLLLLLLSPPFLLANPDCGSSPCLPGINQVGVGYNVLTGESTNVPVLLFHYNQNLTWFDPFANTTYGYPDESFVVNKPIISVDSFVYYKSTDYQSTLVDDSGIGLTLWSGYGAAFSLSRDVQNVEAQMSSSKVAFSLLREYFTLYRVKVDLFSQSLTTQPQFQYSVSLLPETYDESAYGQFVSLYGTHVVTSGIYGGAVLAKTFMDKQFFLDYSSQVCSYNAKLQFLGMKNGVGPTYNHPASSSSAFGINGGKSMDVEFIGGQTTLSISQYDEWVGTVRESPAQVRNTLTQISDFIEDPVRRGLMEMYLASYAANNSDSGEEGMKPQALKLKPCDCHWSTSETDCDRGYVQEVSLDNSDLAVEAPYCCDMCYEWSSADVFPTPATATLQEGVDEGVGEGVIPKKKGHTQEKKTAGADSDDGQCGDVYPYVPYNCGDMPCLPGVDMMGVGFDVVQGSQVASEVIQLTYANGNTWSSPYDDEKVFAYPDQVANGVVSNPTSNSYSYLARSQQEVAFSSSEKNGITIPVPGYFSYSSHVQESSEVFYGGQSILSLYSQTTSLYSLSLTVSLNTTDSFKRAVSALPSTYNSSLYGAFVKNYGTHVIMTGVYGGEASMSCSVDMEYFSSHSDSEVSSSTSLLFVSFQNGQSMTSNNKEFNLHSVAEFELSGGNAATLEFSGPTFYDDWQQSLHCNPSQVERELVEIEVFVTDSQKRANLQRYISDYVAANEVSNKTVPETMTIATYSTNLDGKDTPYCGGNTETLMWSRWYYNAVFDNYNYWVDPYSCSSVGWKSTAAAMGEENNENSDFDIASQMSRSSKVAVNVSGSPLELSNGTNEEKKPTRVIAAGVSPTTNVAGQPYACSISTAGVENEEKQSIHNLACPTNSFLFGFKYYQTGQGNRYAKAPIDCTEMCFDSLY